MSFILQAPFDSPLLVVCRSELSGGCPVYSVRECSTSVNIISQPLVPAHSEPNLSAHSIPQWEISKDGDEADKYKQDIPAAKYIQEKNASECIISTGNTDKYILTKNVQRVHAGHEYLVCPGPMDGEASPRELVLMASTEYHRSTMPHQGLARERLQRETLHLAEEGTTTTLVDSAEPKKDEPPSEQMKSNDTKNDSSSQTRMILQGSAVIFTEEPPYYRSSGEVDVLPHLSEPSHLTFDPSKVYSHTVTESPEDHIPSPWSSVQNSVSNPTRPRPPSVQSIDCLPTFTSQRPQDLPTAMGKRALSNTRYVLGRLKHNMLEIINYYYPNPNPSPTLTLTPNPKT